MASDAYRGKVRLDDGKRNYVADADQAFWFRWASHTLDNGGSPEEIADDVGVLEPWTPPGLFSGVTYEQIDAALDAIIQGLVDDDGNPTGEFYTLHKQGKDRWVVPLIAEKLECEEEKAKRIAKLWDQNKLLYEFDYVSGPKSRERKGLQSRRNQTTQCNYGEILSFPGSGAAQPGTTGKITLQLSPLIPWGPLYRIGTRGRAPVHLCLSGENRGGVPILSRGSQAREERNATCKSHLADGRERRGRHFGRRDRGKAGALVMLPVLLDHLSRTCT